MKLVVKEKLRMALADVDRGISVMLTVEEIDLLLTAINLAEAVRAADLAIGNAEVVN